MTLGVTVTSSQPDVAVSGDGLAVVISVAGPRGAQGVTGGRLVLPAGETLSGHRAVRVAAGAAWYADSGSVTSARECVGMTLGAASVGADVEVATGEDVTEPSWSWSPGPIYLGANGALTQTPPSVGALLEVATAISATAAFVRVGTPVALT